MKTILLSALLLLAIIPSLAQESLIVEEIITSDDSVMQEEAVSTPKETNNAAWVSLALFAKNLTNRASLTPESTFDGLIDVEAFVQRMVEKGMPANTLDMMTTRQLEPMLTSSFNNNLAASSNSIDLYFLKSYQDSLGYHLLMGLQTEDGFNYHDYLMMNSEAGWKIIDLYAYRGGEFFSALLTRILYPMVSSMNASGAYDVRALAFIKDMQQVKELTGRGKWARALRKLKRIDPAGGSEKIWHITKIEIASYVSFEEYSAAIRAFRDRYEDDVACWMVAIDYYFQMNQLNKMDAAMAKLQDKLGYDPQLASNRHAVYIKEDRFQEVLPDIEKDFEAYPKNERFYFLLSYVRGRLGDYEGVAEVITEAYTTLGYNISVFSFKDFPEFLESDVAKEVIYYQGFTLEEVREWTLPQEPPRKGP